MIQFKEIIEGSKPVYYAGKAYYGAGVSYETFDLKVTQIADRLGWLKEWIYAVMFIETAGTFSPKIKNTKSSATGLIQFMEKTAKSLGTTTNLLSKMNAIEQLEYVFKYFYPYRDKVKSGYDVYVTVFRPAWLFDKSIIIKGGTEDYSANRGIDVDNNGNITYQNFIDWAGKKDPFTKKLFDIPLTPGLLTKNKGKLALFAVALFGGLYFKEDIYKLFK
jgi:hypothetical protein